MVAATLSDKNAPTRLRTPDSATATRGPSASVAIEVAIALPVSWKPFVKSKPSATTTTRAIMMSFVTTVRVHGGQVPIKTSAQVPAKG